MFLRLISIVLITAFTTFSQEAPVGTSVQPSPKEKKALDSFKNKLQERSSGPHPVQTANTISG